MKFFHVPEAIQRPFKALEWRLPTKEKVIHLTFDDGPTGEFTGWIMEELAKYNAKATFFCVGENLVKLPEWKAKMEVKGHLVCNHTYNHLNGWKTNTGEYLNNVAKCERLTNNKIFRPPYGMLKLSEMAMLLKDDYRIIMWDVLSYDFDKKLDKEIAFSKIKQFSSPGSIIVFHDNLKAEDNLRYLLPKTLAYFAAEGYSFLTV